MKIGELGKLTATSVDTIRYYERAGLLPITGRSDGNYRIYGPEHVARLQFIRQCRNLDMAHDEIRLLLAYRDTPSEACKEVNALLDQHIEHVVQRIGELQALRQQLEAIRASCPGAGQGLNCGVLDELAQSSTASRASTNHVGGVHGALAK